MFIWPFRWRVLLMAFAAILAVMPYVLRGPIPQDPAYHDFADRRPLLGIPNFADVTSNLLFLAVGIYGIAVVRRRRRDGAATHAGYDILFVGVVLTCFGSAYYHWAPSNLRLLWDRLPMSLGFMGIFAATISERVEERLGEVLALPLVLIGIGSVLLWSISESAGHGDLRLYYCVQYVSLWLILSMIVLFRSEYSRSWELLLALAAYAGAKVTEAQDHRIFQGLGISGHTLKHALAAVSILLMAHMLLLRKRQRHVIPAPPLTADDPDGLRVASTNSAAICVDMIQSNDRDVSVKPPLSPPARTITVHRYRQGGSP